MTAKNYAEQELIPALKFWQKNGSHTTYKDWGNFYEFITEFSYLKVSENRHIPCWRIHIGSATNIFLYAHGPNEPMPYAVKLVHSERGGGSSNPENLFDLSNQNVSLWLWNEFASTGGTLNAYRDAMGING